MDQFEQGKWIRTLWDPLEKQHKSPLVGDQKVKVAAYCRVSSGIDQQTNSLMNQVHYYTQFIRERPHWKFVGIYFDNAVSAKDATKQQGLQRLIRHAKEQRVDFILVKNVARLSRNTQQLLEIVVELKEHGVGVYFEEQQLDTSVTYNEFLLSTYAALAQEEIEQTAYATRWGREKRAKEGVGHFHPLYGYEKVKGGDPPLLIKKDEARVVKQIFDWYLQGNSETRITALLYERGIKTKSGKDHWQNKVIRRMLTNPTYTGNKVDGRFSGKTMLNGEREKADIIWIYNTHPAIIPMAVFDQVQEKIEERTLKQNGTKRKSPIQDDLPFNKRIYCHQCGYSMVRRAKTRGTSVRRCHPGHSKICEGEAYSDDTLVSMFVEAIEKRFIQKDEKQMLKEMRTLLKRINTQDHFEFHRLQWLNTIELARSQQSEKEVLRLEKAYKQFETHITLIEKDRPFRDQAMAWMETIHSFDEFKAAVTPARLRAWMLDASIQSPHHFKVTWVDGTTTSIGGKLPKMKKLKQTGNPAPVKEVKPFVSAPDKDTIQEKGRQPMKPAAERVVEVREPKNKHPVIEMIQDTPWKHQPMCEKRLRTAAYCRVSTTHDDQAGSLLQQIAFYTFSIMKNPNYRFAGIFADDGISGTMTKKRAGLQRLIKACENETVDQIICKSVSRLSRNIVDVLEITRYLASLPKPVFIFFEREGINTASKDADMMLSLFGGIAQEESKNQGSSIAWGLRSQAKRGIIKNHKVSYGYRIDDDHKWQIEEEEAQVVRRIYQLLIEGMTFQAVAERLTKEGVPTPGKKISWTYHSVRSIAENVVYKGDYLFQKSVTTDTIQQRVERNSGQFEQIYIANHHPPIIEPKLWEEMNRIVRTRIEKNTNHTEPKEDIGEKRNPHFVRTMYCGVCGMHYVRMRTTRRMLDEPYHIHYWGCRKKVCQDEFTNQVCSSNMIQQRYIEEHFHHFLETLIPMLDAYEKRAAKWIHKIELTNAEKEEEQHIAHDIESLNQHLYETVREELSGIGRDSKKVDEITSKIGALYERQQAFDERKIRAEEEWARLKVLLRQLKQHDAKEKSFPGDLYDQLIKRAVVYEDGRIHYDCHFDIEWTTAKRYGPYIQKRKERVLDYKDLRKEKLRRSQIASDLLVFCSTPRTWSDMMRFMRERMTITEPRFRNVIIRPFLEEGKLERYRVKGERMRYYYRSLQELSTKNESDQTE